MVLAVFFFFLMALKQSLNSLHTLSYATTILTRAENASRKVCGVFYKSVVTWKYPSSKDVLKAVGLETVDHYIGVRRKTIARFIVDRPLFALCRDEERKRGSTRHTFWWEQPLSLNGAGPLHPGDDKDEGGDNLLLE